ncbi:ABC transporter ATP-binding protein [Labilibacter marinus]|uniref:ABC transporter ATP-binding protein n=1 Tax=Labilibacter marinus TaxID=1477105 RepID=UPI00082E7AC3|nr:ABC transporter ATP-binding protein [Labilibacter marinus]
MNKLININNVSTGYKNSNETKVVGRDISTSLHRGELVCLLGANGAGKSTLMRSMCGFLPTLGGEILLNDMNVERLSDKILAKQVAVVLTDKVLTDNITVEELVGYGRSPYTGFLGKLNKEDNNIVTRSIEQCGILDKKDRQVHSLSDGERQKVMIAKALAQDTPIILLDEPTAFLDLPTRVDVMQLLRELASKGKSILMSTHDLDLALQLADKIWLMNGDGSFEHGTPEDLLIDNAIQNIFNKDKVAFDPKTGAFQVNHKYKFQIDVHGDGFGVLLLQRALSRKGIEVNITSRKSDLYIAVDDYIKPTFTVHFLGEKLEQFHKMEHLVAKVQTMLARELVQQ